MASGAPLLGMVVAGPEFRLNSVMVLKRESVVVCGTYGISIPNSARQIEYWISILMPAKYPKQIPIMFCNDDKLPIGDIDRHIMTDGSACLGVYADIMTRWSLKPDIVNFLEGFVAPFLVWQAYYDAHQKPPPWGERSHFADGIIEYYSELLGMNKYQSVVGFMRLLARKNRPKGHEICPCGSGERLRNCHRELLYSIREKISWQYVVKDLQTVLRGDRLKD
ncbi:MAG: hypothetical protein JRE28_09660 [Deltaproteobacteria bacterium]|nr:hypothetical protein [Deltaproteobacteria bacterium]